MSVQHIQGGIGENVWTKELGRPGIGLGLRSRELDRGVRVSVASEGNGRARPGKQMVPCTGGGRACWET